MSAALVSGDFRILTDVTHGCLPIGTEMEITRIEGNRLYEINNRPAMHVMAEYVGQDVEKRRRYVWYELNPEIRTLIPATK